MKHTALMASVVLLLSFPPLATAQSPLRWAADAEGGAPFIFKEPRNVSRNIGFEVDLKRTLERNSAARSSSSSTSMSSSRRAWSAATSTSS